MVLWLNNFIITNKITSLNGSEKYFGNDKKHTFSNFMGGK